MSRAVLQNQTSLDSLTAVQGALVPFSELNTMSKIPGLSQYSLTNSGYVFSNRYYTLSKPYLL